MIYARLNTDNTLVCVPTVQAPDYTLPGDDPTEHGWTEHATETAAYAHYGLIPEGTISADVEEQLAQLQATIGVMTETLAQLSPEDIAAATQLAVAFLENKDRLNNAVNSVANNNTAKAPVVVLNDIVQGVGAQ